MDGLVTLKIAEHIATVEFFHPKGNSLPGKLLQELASKIKEAGDEEGVRVIILQSKGEGAFCAGASFDELMELITLEDGKVFFSGFAKVIKAIRKAPVFVIARVQGKAVGGGVGLIAACDYAIGTTSSSVKLSELNLGIGPFVIAPVVRQKIGSSALAGLTINASEWKEAQWAYDKGLFNELCTDPSELDTKVRVLSAQLASSSPEAMLEIKKMLWSDDLDELMSKRAEISGKLALSDFTRSFIEKFKS